MPGRLSRSLVVAGLAAALLVATPRASRAGELSDFFGSMGWMIIGTYVLELAVPDLRIELPQEDLEEVNWVLSFPISVSVWHTPDEEAIVGLQALVEPQYQVDGEHARGLLGLRWMFRIPVGEGGPAFTLDMLGLVGDDGHGGVAGVGFAPWCFSHFACLFAVQYRAAFPHTGKIRHDFCVDVLSISVPLN